MWTRCLHGWWCLTRSRLIFRSISAPGRNGRREKDGGASVTSRMSARSSPPVFTRSFSSPQKEDADLALSLGDVRKSIQIEPKTRPELADVTVHLRLPAYLGYQTEPAIEVSGGSVGVLKGAEASFEAKATRDLASAQMDGQSQKVDGAKILTGYEPITADVDRQFVWKDHDGLTPREALMLKVKAVEDAPPTIVARRDSLEQVVLDSEVVTFDLTAMDDFGVKQVGLEWVGSLNQEDGKTPVNGTKIVAAGSKREKGGGCARHLLRDARRRCAANPGGARLGRIDYLPGRPHVHSAAFVLHVLNKTDHALWLTAQFGKWLEAAKESYEQEQQLNQTNKELRALSAADLDRPENRRRVSQQAAAENANASRLDSLTQAGRELVNQATKNDEFDAKRLESWATMLKILAGHRGQPHAQCFRSPEADGQRTGRPSAQRESGRQSEQSPAASSSARTNAAERKDGGQRKQWWHAAPSRRLPRVRSIPTLRRNRPLPRSRIARLASARRPIPNHPIPMLPRWLRAVENCGSR